MSGEITILVPDFESSTTRQIAVKSATALMKKMASHEAEIMEAVEEGCGCASLGHSIKIDIPNHKLSNEIRSSLTRKWGEDSIISDDDQPDLFDEAPRNDDTIIDGEVIEVTPLGEDRQLPPGELPEVTEPLSLPGPTSDEKRQQLDNDYADQATEVIRETGRATTSMIQRRLKIGYNRAARVMDILEARGVIGPPTEDGREILLDIDADSDGEDEVSA